MPRLVVAIDYGTSNSGVAYVLIDDEDDATNINAADIEVIKDWPNGGSGRDGSDKVPSDIAYDDYGRAVGHGFDIPPGSKVLQWVKLLLEPDSFQEKSSRTSRVWRAYELLGSAIPSKAPVDAIADYLRWLWTRTRTGVIEKEDASEEVFEAESLTVVLTVPAGWSERAKDCMKRAAVEAGIPEQSIKLLAEPEAAAIFGLKRQVKNNSVKNGDCVIVLDAGGGTVDSVAYQVRSRTPLSLDQITRSKGAFCGSVFIDEEFQNQFRSVLGDDFAGLDDELRARIEDDFEYKIKRSYEVECSRRYHLPVGALPDDNSRCIKNGRLEVDDAMISQSFESIMTQIMELVDWQRDQIRDQNLTDKIKGILLVGGLSKSNYLRSRVRQEFPRDDMKVWPVDSSWTAVVQGAVLCETSSAVHSRLSGYNYGVPYLDGTNRRVHWLVRKNERVQSNMPTKPYALRIDDEPWLAVDKYCRIIVTVVRSDDENASNDYGECVVPHAEIDCRVPTNLRHSGDALLIQEAGKKRAWHIPARLVLYLEGAVISFRCKIEESEVGVADVTYFTQEEGNAAEDLRNRSEVSLGTAFTESSSSKRQDSPIVSDTQEMTTRPPENASESPAISPARKKLRVAAYANIFTSRTRRDLPKEKKKRPPPAPMPGLYNRGWIPRT